MEKFLFIQDWVSVEEKLPNMEEEVLGINQFDEQEVCRRTKWWEDEPESWRCSGHHIFYPTHWMPLPRSPRSEFQKDLAYNGDDE